jgi:hypothetical protein
MDPQDENGTPANSREMGIQPLDTLLTEFGMSNHDVVAACAGQLAHKTVMSARRGRMITRRMQFKIMDAFNAAMLERFPEKTRLAREQLFSY